MDRFGLDGFRLLLQRQGLKTLQKDPRAALRSPETTVLVLIGDLRATGPLWNRIDRFVAEGGAVLIATDLGSKPIRGVNLRAGSVPVRGIDAYQGYEDCPRVSDLDRHHVLLRELFDDVDEIITNVPGFLPLRPVAELRRIAWLPQTRRKKALMAGYVRRGRMLLVADHSIFVNEMLLHGDNAKLANNVCQWLSQGGERDKLVFISDGLVLPEWELGSPNRAVPLSELIRAAELARQARRLLPGETLVEFLNRFLTSYEDRNGFNIGLANLFPRFTASKLRVVLRRFVIVGVAMVAAAMFLRWLVGTRWRLSGQDPNPPAEPRELDGVGRQQCGLCLRVLARDFFLRHGCAVDDWKPSLPSPMVVVTDSSKAREIANDVRRFWSLATARRMRPMGVRKFRRLLRRLQQLQTLQEMGELQLEWGLT